jgi:hypothetical protein
MRYTVIWIGIAEQELAALWLAATDRSGINAASNRIERLLSWNADTVGTLSFDTVRTLLVSPLGVDFEFSTDDHLVSVLSVWDLNDPPT